MIKLRFAGAALLSTLLGTAAYAADVTMSSDYWYPFNGEPGAEKPGYLIEIAQKTLSKHGHRLVYTIAPWERSIAMAREGKIDCILGAYKEDAPDFVFPDEPLGADDTVFFVKADNPWRYDGIPSLEAIKLGVTTGYAYGDQLDEYIEANQRGSKVQGVSGDDAMEKNIKKLQAGRIGAVVDSSAVFLAKTADMGLSDKFVAAGLLDEAGDIYIACSPAKDSSTEYTRIFADGIGELRKSGELQTILARYGLKDWK